MGFRRQTALAAQVCGYRNGHPEKLAITAFLSNWNIAPAVDDAQFSFVPPKGPRRSLSHNSKTGGQNAETTGGKS